MTKPVAEDLTEFLRARLDEIEMWANEASRHPYSEEPLTEGGQHWQWECNVHDLVIEPDPLLNEDMRCSATVDPCYSMSLRSREQYPYRSLSAEGPSIHLSAEEIRSVVAGHIIRHDPAHVLADVQVKRRIIEALEHHLRHAEGPLLEQAWMVVSLLGSEYADHPGYREEWA